MTDIIIALYWCGVGCCLLYGIVTLVYDMAASRKARAYAARSILFSVIWPIVLIATIPWVVKHLWDIADF